MNQVKFYDETASDPDMDKGIYVKDVALDAQDNIYVVGYVPSYVGQYREKAIIIKFNSSGEKIWAKYLSISYGANDWQWLEFNTVKIDAEGNAICVGSYYPEDYAASGNCGISLICKFTSDGTQVVDTQDSFERTVILEDAVNFRTEGSTGFVIQDLQEAPSVIDLISTTVSIPTDFAVVNATIQQQLELLP